ncbi:MAG TPA: DUF6647 family protein [Burkholderiales bacterium]|nr:DUF6647 family protein [Burkholderiales bacterium]
METLLTAIVTWLSIGFGLPANYDHPRIEFVSPAKMSAVQFRGEAAAHSAAQSGETSAPARPALLRDVEALYDDATRTIYLPEGWTGKTPAEVSVLVHEMVHHLQNRGGLKYECPQAREKLAYTAQNQWLARFGRTLIDEFRLNALTVLVRTNCMH